MLFGIVPGLIASATTYDVYRATETKGSFCNVIGGACAADPDFDGGFFQNPAALAAGEPGFDFDFDFDFDRQSAREPGTIGVNRSGTLEQMGALAGAIERFGFGVSYVADDTRTLAAYSGGSAETRRVDHALNFPFGFALDKSWQVGLAINLAWTHLTTAAPVSPIADRSDPSPSLGWTLGALHSLGPRASVGAWVRLPSRYRSEELIGARDYSRALARPLVVALGARIEARRWSVLAQLDAVGTSADGALYAGNDFALEKLGEAPPAKGRDLVLNPHLGVRGVLLGHWTGFAGTYLESARVAGTDSRAHLTLGLSYKVPLGLSWWDVAEFMAGFDGARDYQRFILTFR